MERPQDRRRLISFPAPDLCEFADQEALVWLGETISPGFIEQPRSENGLRLWVEGEPADDEAAERALGDFQTLLGVLRAWRQGAGELREERLGGLGEGSVRDQAGNQWVKVHPAVAYITFGKDDVQRFAHQAREAMKESENLHDALRINGRPNRTSADYYLIYEYAEAEFGGKKGIREALGPSENAQDLFTASANNLSPLRGGRHARGDGIARMDLGGQRRFTSHFLRSWIQGEPYWPRGVKQSVLWMGSLPVGVLEQEVEADPA